MTWGCGGVEKEERVRIRRREERKEGKREGRETRTNLSSTHNRLDFLFRLGILPDLDEPREETCSDNFVLPSLGEETAFDELDLETRKGTNKTRSATRRKRNNLGGGTESNTNQLT